MKSVFSGKKKQREKNTDIGHDGTGVVNQSGHKASQNRLGKAGKKSGKK